jgi:hypothetical protein
MDAAIATVIDGLGPSGLDAVEISGESHEHRPWKSYTSVKFPTFDLCKPYEGPAYDVVLCEQVLEHVVDPCTAVRTLRRMTRERGVAIVSTPFLVRLHAAPSDYWRFSPDGLRVLLESGGFTDVSVGSWGNRRAVASSLTTWVAHRRWHSLDNDPTLPAVVWAFAR